jgi:hypothetical protein
MAVPTAGGDTPSRWPTTASCRPGVWARLRAAVGGPVGAAEERVAHRRARRDAQRAGEDRGWRLADELAPGGQPACPGEDTQLVKGADEPAAAAMVAGELPGKQPRRGWIGGRGHVAAVAQVLSQQGGNGLGHVEPVRAELAPSAQEVPVVRSAAILLTCWPYSTTRQPARRSPGARVSSSSSRRIAASRASVPGGQASAPSALIAGMGWQAAIGSSRTRGLLLSQTSEVVLCRSSSGACLCRFGGLASAVYVPDLRRLAARLMQVVRAARSQSRRDLIAPGWRTGSCLRGRGGRRRNGEAHAE